MKNHNLSKLILYGMFTLGGTVDSFYKDSLDPLIAAAGLIGIFESSSRALVYLEKRGYVNLDYERMLRGYPVKNQSIHSTSNDTNKK